VARGAAGVAENRQRLVVVEEQPDGRAEQDEKLEDDADAVQDRHHPDARRDQDSRRQRRDDGDDHLMAQGDRQVSEKS